MPSAPPRPLDALSELLRRLDGGGYGEYRRVEGTYDAGDFLLHIDHVQGDPFAQPSRVRVTVSADRAATPDWVTATDGRRVAAADYLNRTLAAALRSRGGGRGSGRSGDLVVLVPGQEVLRRSSVIVGPAGTLEARFRVGLPARGRRILGREASRLLTESVVAAVRAGLLYRSADLDALQRHLHAAEDAGALRAQLEPRGLVAFVADGAVLPRRSGVDDRPRAAGEAIPFQSPEALRVTLETAHAGPVTGMGVPAGITLVAGGGYHGKSTLLRALERGVYDHVPGDGRERVVALPGTVKIRAEDGRRVAGADISNFIGHLPDGADTRRFVTENASGSTSQAAAIVEALEVGATCLLLDEDTSATNFMIRDARMQALVDRADEPITPFLDRARQLHEDLGVSTVLVVGGSGDYFDVADTVIVMRAYRPHAATAEARRIAAARPTQRARESRPWVPIRPRVPVPQSIDPGQGGRPARIRVHGRTRATFGTDEVDLAAVEQIVEAAQTRAMAETLAWARDRSIDGARTVGEAVRHVMEVIAREGLDAIHPEPIGELAGFRPYELAAMLNRIRTLRIEG